MYLRRMLCVDYSGYSPQGAKVFAAEAAVNVEDNHRMAGAGLSLQLIAGALVRRSLVQVC
jgi:hypothetical protein